MVNGNYATNLTDALEFLAGNNTKIYAGGTDIMIKPPVDGNILFIDSIPELLQIEELEDGLHIGAAVSFSKLYNSEIIPEVLKTAVSKIAAPAIRNNGTIGGNIANGSPKADTAVVLFSLDARLKICSKNAERIVEIADFYEGRGKVKLASNEILTEVIIPKSDYSNFSYHKISAREALAISRLSFAGIVEKDGDKIKNLAISFGAVSDTVLRFKDIESKLIGKSCDECKEMLDEILLEYDKRIIPTSGRVSAEYRKNLVNRLLKEFFVTKLG